MKQTVNPKEFFSNLNSYPNKQLGQNFINKPKPFPGLESGPIRSQEPPLKHFDNGNVQML